MAWKFNDRSKEKTALEKMKRGLQDCNQGF